MKYKVRFLTVLKQQSRRQARAFMRTHREMVCVGCGSRDGMTVHHKDHNVFNNGYDNLEWVCWPCHTLKHQSETHASTRYDLATIVKTKPATPRMDRAERQRIQAEYTELVQSVNRLVREGQPVAEVTEGLPHLFAAWR